MVRCCRAFGPVAAPADRAFHLGRLDRYRCSRVFVLAGRPRRCGRRARELQASLDSAPGLASTLTVQMTRTAVHPLLLFC
jgi:hypothetical protein